MSFSPASHVVVFVGAVVAERLLYLPSVGFCMLVAALGDMWVEGELTCTDMFGWLGWSPEVEKRLAALASEGLEWVRGPRRTGMAGASGWEVQEQGQDETKDEWAMLGGAPGGVGPEESRGKGRPTTVVEESGVSGKGEGVAKVEGSSPRVETPGTAASEQETEAESEAATAPACNDTSAAVASEAPAPSDKDKQRPSPESCQDSGRLSEVAECRGQALPAQESREARAARRRRWWTRGLWVYILILGGRTAHHAQVWTVEEEVFKNAVRTCPRSAKVRSELGLGLGGAGSG